VDARTRTALQVGVVIGVLSTSVAVISTVFNHGSVVESLMSHFLWMIAACAWSYLSCTWLLLCERAIRGPATPINPAPPSAPSATPQADSLT
jgi:hypothetical protein